VFERREPVVSTSVYSSALLSNIVDESPEKVRNLI
jgi:hypothetical protein